MPYIKHEDRIELKVSYQDTFGPQTDGELNYVLTTICHHYLHRKGVNYQNINEIIGVLECAKLEFYRRIASPYEDIKIKENGDL